MPQPNYVKETTIGSIASALCCIAIVAGITYGCTQSSKRYYEAQQNCVSHGGSWVPTGSTDTAACIAPRKNDP